MADNSALISALGPAAEAVFGEINIVKNKAMSTRDEFRFGTNGAISVKVKEGVWYDHEDSAGGNVIDLLRAFKGLETPEALDWLVERGLIPRREREIGAKAPAKGAYDDQVPAWMEHKPVAIFDYHDEKGKLAYQVLKFPKDAGRRYMQRRPHPVDGSWVWGLQEDEYGKIRSGDWFKAKEEKQYLAKEKIPDAVRYLYRRAEALAAIKRGDPIVLVEGEKDAETVRGWGLTATTNAGGAKYWSEQFDEDLKGANVIICHDNDDVGRQRALLRGGTLKEKATSVRVLDLSKHWKAMPVKGDVTDWKEQAGGTKEKFEQLLSKAPLWKPETPKSLFGAFSWSDLDAPGLEHTYIIDGYLTERGRSVLGGTSGSGKSFVAIHASMCVARGVDFLGHQVMRGGVIYQAGEGGHGIKKRFKAYREHFQVKPDEDIPLVVLPVKVDLFSKEGDTQKLIDEINTQKLVMSQPLRLVVIDTLATASVGADENSGKDMGFVLDNIAKIEAACGVHVCLVHHMNADAKKLRGHTSIHANVDQVIVVNNDEETGIRSMKLVKQKDDESGQVIKFSLASVPVGFNPITQREITSCVVLTVSEKEHLKKEQERLGFSTNPTERRILMNLFKALDRHGRLVAHGEKPAAAVGKIVVDYRAYRDVALESMPEIEDKKKAADRVSKEFGRAKDWLIKGGVIGVDNPYMWWAGKPVRGFQRTFPKGQASDESREGEGRDAGYDSPGMREVLSGAPSDEEIQL